jgi:hypothetical protein
VTEHKFKIGQLVYFHPKAAVRPQLDVVPGTYHITKRLPAAEDGECQYEIRNTLEEYNRVARESELTRAQTLAGEPLLASASPRTSPERLIVLLCLVVERPFSSRRTAAEWLWPYCPWRVRQPFVSSNRRGQSTGPLRAVTKSHPGASPKSRVSARSADDRRCHGCNGVPPDLYSV